MSITSQAQNTNIDAMIDMILRTYHTTRLATQPAAVHIRTELGARLLDAIAEAGAGLITTNYPPADTQLAAIITDTRNRLGSRCEPNGTCDLPLRAVEILCNAAEAASQPIPMVIHCPRCHVQHIDEASETWNNPPHRSHQCQSCGTVWRPADVATAGVASISTIGKSDDWQPGEPALADLLGASLWQLLAHIGAISPTSTMRASELALEAHKFMSGTFNDSLRHGIQLVRHLATAEAADPTDNTCMVPRQLVIEVAAAAERSLSPKVSVLARLDERTLLTIPVVKFGMNGDGTFSAQIDLTTFRRPSPLARSIGEDNDLRDEVGAILEQVAAEGLHQPRDLDVALDAIFTGIEATYIVIRKAEDSID